MGKSKKERASKKKKRSGKKSGDETGHRQGKMVTTSHTTCIKEVGMLVDAMRTMPEVTKVTLSIIKPLKSGTPRMKVAEVDAGLELKVRGRTAVQTFYVYTAEKAVVQAALERVFAKKVR